MKAMFATLLLLFFVANTASFVEGKKRVKPVRSGNHYNQHDPVHVTVNKIGYVHMLCFDEETIENMCPRIFEL